MDVMNEIQQKAFDIYIQSANLENDFTPISERALAKKLHDMGLKSSMSAIGRWKKKFGWAQALQNEVTLAMSRDKPVKDMLRNSSLKAVVENTKVDIERNDVLMASSYQFFETEAREILEKKRNGEFISKEERETMKFIATLSTTRKDKMLDRMALMPRDAVSADEILSRFSAISLEVEDDAIDIEPSEASGD